MKKYFKQFKYLIMHKLRVFKACIKEGMIMEGIFHDIDKFYPRNFIIDSIYFYGKRNDEIIYKHFKNYRYHRKHNKHHTQYWKKHSNKITEQMIKECAIDRLDCSINRKRLPHKAVVTRKKLKPYIEKLNYYLKEKQLAYN